ncbi:sigma-E processing peptidase SpoIIGA [Natranaerobius trueperi]|uniref:sigma-E processing peptidase SpoIIGA n=1 Tax=Natranaerobius trueperi TaxID=759412 RepID=UPI0013033A77|nr:sigma-E processing peptidase SpoIIGA [Natranaerobius trueperi]
MYIIGEVLLIINLLINSILLFITGKLLNIRILKYKIFLASLVGAIGVLLPSFNGDIILKIVISLLMVLIAFGRFNPKSIIVVLLSFYGVSFLVGGGIFGILYLTANIHEPIILLPGDLSFKYLFLVLILGFGVISATRLVERKTTLKRLSIPVKVKFNGKSKNFKVLVDTGNQLKTFTGEYCLVVEAQILEDLLSFQEKNFMSQFANLSQDIEPENLHSNTKVRFFPIWFQSLGNQHGFLFAFRPEELFIKKEVNDKEWQEVSALIAVTFQNLNIDGENNGLISLELFNYAEG